MSAPDGSASDPFPGPLLDVERPGRVTLRLVLGPPLVVGRECEGLILDDPQISRRHVELRLGRSGVEITDLGSTNGTYVDGERVEGTVVAAPGTTIALGSVTLRLHELERSAPRRPSATLVTADARRTSIDHVAALVAVDALPVADAGHRHGTITIVFSDIEGSTTIAASVGDARWFELLDEHNRIVLDATRRAGGTMVKNQGDGFMLTFPSARRALLAMVEVQRRLQRRELDAGGTALRVRVGLHTGEAIVDDDGDLFGHHVNMAARVGGVAGGGEILVSALTRAILETHGDIEFDAPRAVELKGIAGTHLVHPVRWTGVDATSS